MHETTHSASIEQMLEEHREMREMVEKLKTFLDRPRPTEAEDDCNIWAGALSERLVRLHVRLCKHFREEEREHLLERLAEHFPRASRRLDALHGEHRQMLTDLRAIIAATLSYAEGTTPPNPQLGSWTHKLIKQLQRHEETETALMQRLYNEEIGAGD